VFQKVQIIAQYPLTVQFLLLERSCQRVFRFLQRSRSGRLIRVNAEVIRQLLCRLQAGQVKQPCHEVDHISLCSTAEAIEIILVQLHAGGAVIVEWTADHVVTAYF